jgi:diaminopimelate decarboxylase
MSLEQRVNIVGPICESADQLGTDRWLAADRRG